MALNSIIHLITFFYLTTCTIAAWAATNTPPTDAGSIYGTTQGPRDLEPWVRFVGVKQASSESIDIHLINEENVFHAEFVKSKLIPNLDIKQINQKALFATNRELYFGYLFLGEQIYSAGTNVSKFSKVSFDLASIDLPNLKEIKILDQSLKNFLIHVLESQKLSFSPKGKFAADIKSQSNAYIKAGIKLIFSDNSLKEEVYTAGWAIGKIKRLSNEQVLAAHKAGDTFMNEILVLEGAPMELPPAAGYIISLPSSQNSHPALLAQMMSAPLVYLQNAFQSEKLKLYEKDNSTVFLKVRDVNPTEMYRTSQTVYLGPIDQQTYQELAPLKVKPIIGNLRIEPNTNEIIESFLHEGSALNAAAYGAKASGLMEIQNTIEKNYTIPSLFIPLHYQLEFLKVATVTINNNRLPLKDSLANLLSKAQTQSSSELSATLSQIRLEIQNAEVSPEFFKPLVKQVRLFSEKHSTKKLFFRSSSNAEDHELFNGAGLYDSKSSAVEDEAIIKAIRIVWSSLYNYRAFWARKQFSINESSVGMGIVVQGFLPDIKSQGVIVSKIIDENRSEVKMTSFPGLLQVTSPPEGKTPESIIIDGVLGSSEKQRSIVNYCDNCDDSLRKNELILKENEYISISQQVDRLLKKWPKVLDIEWLKSGEQVYFVQAREVPQTNKLKQSIFIGSSLHQLKKESIDGDSDEPAILRLRANIAINLRLQTQLQFNKNLVGALSYSYQGEQHVIKNNELQIQHVQNENINKLIVSLNYAKNKSLNLTIEQERFSDQKDVAELISPADLMYNVSFDGVDAFPKTKRKRLNEYFFGEVSYFKPYHVRLRSEKREILNQRPEKAIIDATLTNGKPIRTVVTYLKDSDPKHYTVEIKNVALVGLIPNREITFSNPAAFTYTAKDHHPSPELALDFKFADIPDDVKNSILKKGRYLWIFSDGFDPKAGPDDYAEGLGGFALISEDGKSFTEITKPKDGVTWKSQID